MSTPRRVLFVLRGKLGDTLLRYSAVRAYADANPSDDVTLLVRAAYAPLVAGERGIRVIGFSSRLAMMLRLAWMRWTEPAFDALAVLLGAGPPIERIGRMVRARRRIYLDGRFASMFPEWPEIRRDHLLFEPAWSVARMVDPALPFPTRLRIPGLEARRSRDAAAIGIVPISDEARRTFGVEATRVLCRHVTTIHPGREIRILVNRNDREAAAQLAAGPAAGTVFRHFSDVASLLSELSGLEHLYATDTGLYHVAIAMGLPTTVLFGPTQPWKNGFSRQPDLVRVRLAALGGEHCDEKACRRPACLDRAVALFANDAARAPVDATPETCLLRRHREADLERIETLLEAPAVEPPA